MKKKMNTIASEIATNIQQDKLLILILLFGNKGGEIFIFFAILI